MNHLLSIRQLALSVTTLTIAGLCLSASAAPPVPFKGRADVVITDFEDPAPGIRKLTATATGLATHLGRFTRTETLVLDQILGSFTGTLEFTAANGDLLKADFAGQFTSLTTAVGTYEFTGGSGRFQHASGRADFEATTADGMNFNVKFNGTIQY